MDTEIRLLFAEIAKYRWGMVATFAIVMLFVVCYAWLVTPMYRGRVVMISPQQGEARGGLSSALSQIGGLRSLVSLGMMSGTDREEAVAVLISRSFTEAFVVENDLLPILFSDMWNEQAQRWREPSEQPSLQDAYELFNNRIRAVNVDDRTGLVALEVDWKDPYLAASWANSLIGKLNSEMRTRARAEADKSLKYLYAELEQTNVVEARQALYTLIESEMRRIMMANVREEFAFRILDPAKPADRDRPVWPKRLLLLAIGSMLGIVLALAYAYARRLGFPRIRAVNENAGR